MSITFRTRIQRQSKRLGNRLNHQAWKPLGATADGPYDFTIANWAQNLYLGPFGPPTVSDFVFEPPSEIPSKPGIWAPPKV